MVDQNPFTPGLGRSPKVLVGRDDVLESLRYAFASGYDPTRKSIFRAPAASGKTALLNAATDMADDAGWMIIHEDAGLPANGPLLERFTTRLQQYLDDMSFPRGGLGTNTQPATGEPARLLRDVLDRTFAWRGSRGVLLAIDEIHEVSRDDLHQIGNVVQHLEDDGRPIALFLAGLPDHDSTEPMFLSRYYRPPLGTVSDTEIARGFTDTARAADWRFTGQALSVAVRRAAGFPYMMQLVGYRAFQLAQQAGGSNRTIGTLHVVEAIPDAELILSQKVLGDRARHLLPGDHKFLVAMAHDNGDSRLVDIAHRTHESRLIISVHRDRLIEDGLIRPTGHGHVNFVVPGHRAQLRATHAFAVSIASRKRRDPSTPPLRRPERGRP